MDTNLNANKEQKPQPQMDADIWFSVKADVDAKSLMETLRFSRKDTKNSRNRPGLPPQAVRPRPKTICVHLCLPAIVPRLRDDGWSICG